MCVFYWMKGFKIRTWPLSEFVGLLMITNYRFYVHGSVYRESMSIIVQQDTSTNSFLYFCKLLYMFRVISSPIIRSTHKL